MALHFSLKLLNMKKQLYGWHVQVDDGTNMAARKEEH